MMLEEFERRTGFFPSHNLYVHIEKAYMESGLDKDAFCMAYKANKDGLAEKIQREASVNTICEIAKLNDEKKQHLEEIARLKKELEREQEWQPYESDSNVMNSDYARLANAGGTRILTDDEAKLLISDEYGFDKSRITILHAVNKEEINRHRQVRIVGTISREPIYNATDWNYVRFDCANWYYEMYNGQLHQFYC